MAETLSSAAASLSDRLQSYLRQRFPDRRALVVNGLTRLPGGASRETWAYPARWETSAGPVERSFILRRDPPASVVTTERETEARVLRAARAAGLPVAEVDCLETDGRWLGSPFLILERVAGTASRPALFSPRNVAARPVLAEQFVQWLAYLHRLPWRDLDLGDLTEPAPGLDAARQQVAYWQSILNANALETHVILAEALRWLAAHLPATDRIVWLHGDYRAGNFMFRDDQIVSLLDWELSHLGDPLEDVAWACMDFWGQDGRVAGLVDRPTFLRRYEELSSIPADPDRVFFYEVLGNVKMAIVALTGVRAYCDGRTPEPLMAYLACLPPELERQVVDLLGWRGA